MLQVEKLVLVIVFLALGSQSFGQKTVTEPKNAERSKCVLRLEGTIIDSASHNHLVGVTVFIKELNKGLAVDSNGHFEFQNLCTGTYTIEFALMGYETYSSKYHLVSDLILDIHLHEGAFQFKVVNVSATFYKNKQTANSQTLNQDQRLATTGQTLGEMLKQQPGVFALQTGPTIAKPIIRGLSGSRVLIINNGVRQEGQQWGSEHAPEIDPYAANSISVVKGASSLRYGADAFGGSIVLEPATLFHERGIRGNIQTAGGTNGKYGSGSVMVEGNTLSIPKLGWRIQTSMKQAGNLQTAKYYLGNTGVAERNLSLAVGWKEKNYGLNSYYSSYYTKLGIFTGSHIGNIADLERAYHRPDSSFHYGFSYAIGRPYQEIAHQLLKTQAYWENKRLGKFTFTASYQHDNRKEYDLHRPRGATSDAPELSFILKTFQYETLYEHLQTSKWKGHAGLQYGTQSNVALGRILIPNFRLYTGAAFISERYFAENWEVEAGLRADYRWQKSYQYVLDSIVTPLYDYSSVSGSVGLIRYFKNNYTAKINMNSGWRAPGVNELFSNGVHHGSASYEEGNPNLKPERSLSTALGIEKEEGKLTLILGVYANYIGNYMYLQPQYPVSVLTIRGAFPYFKYQQANVLFHGVDGQVDYAVNARLSTSTKVSLVRTWNYSANDYLILTPATRLSQSVKVLLNKKYQIQLLGEVEKVWQQNKAPQNQDFLPPPAGYYLCNASIQGRFIILKQLVRLSIKGTNLFNVAYRDYLNRFRYYNYDLGRNVGLALNIPIG